MSLRPEGPTLYRASAEETELLLAALPGAGALLDRSGTVKAVNDPWSAWAGPNPFLEAVVPGSDYLQLCQRLSRSEDGPLSLVAIGLVSAVRGNIRRLKLEYPVRTPEGTLWFSAVAHTQEGGTVVSHQDITERTRWEKRVRRGEQLFRATTENALDLIAVLDQEGQAVYASPSYGSLLGSHSAVGPMARPVDLVLAEDRERFESSCRIAIRSGLSPFFEYRVARRDGSVCHLEARAAAVDDAGGMRDTILLISRDITAKKESERQRALLEVQLRHAQKMEAIGQLAAGIAHEINTPCQFINDNMKFLGEAFRSFLEVLGAVDALPEGLPAFRSRVEEQDLPYLAGEVPKALQESLEGLQRIATIVHAMKVFGHPGVEGSAAVDLNEAIQNTAVVARSEWKYLADLELDLDPGLPPVVCSAGEINQVLLNLIVNAAHAIGEACGTGGERGVIAISTRRLGEEVEIQVRDTGAGIPEPIRDRVFDPFFTTKPVGKGTGQGLAIAHSVVARHGGNIAYTTQVGKGTCFTVRLPLKPSAPGPEPA